MKQQFVLPALCGMLALSASHFALASSVNVGVSVNSSAPARVVAAPVVAATTTISIGWHGDRYWDGHRYWSRHDWEAQHPIIK